MKKLSTTALMIATGMASSAQAADFEVNSTTTLEVFGAVELKYGTRDKIDEQGDTSSTSDLEDNGSVVGVGAEHRFASGLTAYAAAEFAYSVLGDKEDDDESFSRDESYFGLRGDFGDVRAGQ
ncbi:MAG: porin, partial [Halorhodospira sp.]